MDFTQLKYVTDSAKLLIYGFIRNYSNALSINMIIPEPVFSLCLLYYFLHIIDLELPPSVTVVYTQIHSYFSKKHQKEYLIFAPGSSSGSGIHLYDISENKWSFLIKYPQTINLMCAISIIDAKRDLLYVLGGLDSCFAVLDLITEKWSVIKKSSGTYRQGLEGRGLIFDNGELQLLKKTSLENDHVRWNTELEIFESISPSAIEQHDYLIGVSFCYIKGKQWLMQFGGYIDDLEDRIWFTKYKENKQVYVWNEFVIKLPYAACVSVAIVFDFVVVIFDAKNEETWVLDLGQDVSDYKWVRSRLKKHEHPSAAEIIGTENNWIHFVSAWEGKRVHFKIHLQSFLPFDIYSKYAYTK